MIDKIVLQTELERLQEKKDQIELRSKDHPERFLEYVGKNGFEYTQDCRLPQHIIRKHMKRNQALDNDVKTALDRKSKIWDNGFSKEKRSISFRINQILKDLDGKIKSTEFVLNKYDSYLLDLFADFTTVETAYELLQSEKNVKVDKNDLWKWRKRYEEKISAMRTDRFINQKKDDLKVGNEAARLIEYNKLLEFWSREMETAKADGKKSLAERATKMILAILEGARKETKGELITVKNQIDITATINANKSVEEAFSKLNINNIIVGLVASQKGIDPSHLMASLAGSHYAKYNGFSGAITLEEAEQHPGDLIKQYDWGAIQRDAEEKNPKPKKLTEVVEVVQPEEQQEEKMSDEKRLIMNKLAILRKQLKQ